MAERICPACGDPVTGHQAKVYCSQRCGRVVAKRRNRARQQGREMPYPTRPCPACGTKVSTAKSGTIYCDGCVSAKRPALDDRACDECSVSFSPSRQGVTYCSKRCRMRAYDRDRRPARRKKLGPPTPLSCHRCGCPRSSRTSVGLCVACKLDDAITVRTIHFPHCAVCGGEFETLSASARYCSDQCRRQKVSHRLMGLYRTAMEELDIPRASMWHRTLCEYLADRDGGRCAICERMVRMDLPSGPRGDDRGPSIDHVVPVSHGGSDDLANLQLACWGCNRGKRAGYVDEGEQLRLVG